VASRSPLGEATGVGVRYGSDANPKNLRTEADPACDPQKPPDVVLAGRSGPEIVAFGGTVPDDLVMDLSAVVERGVDSSCLVDLIGERLRAG